MNELLIEIKKRLNQIAIIGLKSVSEDFRLKKLLERLQPLTTKSAVFDKIYKLISDLLVNSNSQTFIDIINLIDAVLYTQSKTDIKEKQTDLKLLDNHKNITFLSYSELNKVKQVLNGNYSNVNWTYLKQLYDENRLNDYRLLNDFLKKLNDSNSYNPNQSISIIDIISGYGESVIPVLLKNFDASSNTVKASIIKIISKIGKKKYNQYYLDWLQKEENESVICSCLKALAFDKSNEEYLLNYKTRKKKVQQSRIYALSYMSSDKSHDEVKNYCLKNIEFLVELINQNQFLSDKELSDLIKSYADNILNLQKTSNNPDEISNKIQDLNYIIKTTLLYNSEIIIDSLIYTIELDIDKQSILETPIILLLKGNQRGIEFLANENKKYKKSTYFIYLDASFIASLKIWSKQKVYDEFAHSILNIHKTLIETILRYCNGYTDYLMISNYNVEQFVDKKMEWDSRWLDYSIQQNFIYISTFFIDNNISDTKKQELKDYYLECLDKLVTDKSRPLQYNNKKREKLISDMKGIVSGLFKTGAKQQAIESLYYFSNYIYYGNEIFEMSLEYLTNQDIQLLEDTELKFSNSKNNNFVFSINRIKSNLA